MKLAADWPEIVKRAWSFRIVAAAALLSGLEVALQLIGESLPVSRWHLAVVMFGVTASALVARVVAQRNLG